ncbi:MAG TPA: isopentenyl-diphosphate Delta-isomerase [Longimicrobiaceae bacterium]|nr:isopentenyl-diphosphate Delta-isomerase [Longimicrobiaceae bacterium]
MRGDAEMVVLVDERDRETGVAEKLAAHREGRLHRAFSVFVFDQAGSLLLQRRADGKYHSAGLWTNTCCSHPRPGEAVEDAAHRRLAEEMGFDCELRPAFTFVYRADFPDGLVEHELDHVLVGRWSGSPAPDAEEVGGWRWAAPGELLREMEADPEAFTHWFRIALPELLERQGS